MEKIKIIIADDVEIMNKAKVEYLQKLDFVDIIGVAQNGKEEYDMIKELKPNIVITDNQMPFMNGTEVIKNVISDEEIQEKPYFIIVSSDTLIEYRTKFKKLRIIEIINKNYGFQEVNKILEERLREEYEFENMEEKIVTSDSCSSEDNSKTSIFNKIKNKLKGNN